jgi:phage terminase large subunit-like protein
LYFPPQEEGELPVHLVWYWLPEMTAKERVSNDNVNYDVWIEQQYIIETPGNVLDYEFIYAFITGETWSGKDAEDFEGLVNMFNIVSSAYDMWNSAQIVSKMEEYGMVMNKFGQGFRSMSTPTKDIERIIIGCKVVHGGNPVLRWNFSNVELQTSPAGDIKIDKKKSAEKVDGAVTFVMSYGEWLTAVTADEEEESSFEVIT